LQLVGANLKAQNGEHAVKKIEKDISVNTNINHMQTNYLILEDPSQYISHVPCAVHIRAPSAIDTQRRNVHFVIVIDTSESMLEQSRLENVKHSASLVLNFLGPNDHVSLITFGNESMVHCSSVSCTSEQKGVIQAIINKIHVDGCTNLSAAILNIKTVLTNDSAFKTGVLLLTDGHANRGIYSDDKVLGMFNTLHEQYPAVSFTVVGYGMDHNAILMKAIAESTQGDYSIVENLEAAASVIGNTIGGLFSCSSQMIRLKCPQNTQVHPAHKVNADGIVYVGDIYDDSEQIILFNVPKEAIDETIELTGMTLPSMTSFSMALQPTPWTSGQSGPIYTAVKLTNLRYRCSDLFNKLANRERINTELESFRTAVYNTEYDGNPVAEMLRVEYRSLEIAHRQSNVNLTHLYQHVAFNNLGRGMTQPMNTDDNPNEPEMVATAHMTSPMSSRLQRRITSLMASMSVGGADAQEAQQEAQALSQANPT